MVELLRLHLMQLGHEMAVAVECRLNRGMTQLRLDVVRVGAVGDQETRIGMAEVVEAHPAEASAPERLRELPVTEVIRVEGRASLATEDKLTASCDRQPTEGASSVGGMSMARRERLDFGVPSVPRQSDRRT